MPIKRPFLAIESFDLAFNFGHQGIAFAIQRFSGGDFDPAFADAIFVNIRALFIVEADANVMFKDRSVVERAARID